MAIPSRPSAEAFLNARRDRRPPKHAYPIRLQPALHEQLAGFARRNDRPMSDVIRTAVREYLERNDV